MKKRNIVIFSILFILIDQFIKYLVVKYISFDVEIIIIKNFLSLVNISNTGAAFGSFSNNTLFIIFISLFLILYLFNELRKTNDNKLCFSLILIISGSFGNLIDRIFRGYVVDYIFFNIFKISMPIFNFADICITLGVLFFMLLVVKEKFCENTSK